MTFREVILNDLSRTAAANANAASAAAYEAAEHLKALRAFDARIYNAVEARLLADRDPSLPDDDCTSSGYTLEIHRLIDSGLPAPADGEDYLPWMLRLSAADRRERYGAIEVAIHGVHGVHAR